MDRADAIKELFGHERHKRIIAALMGELSSLRESMISPRVSSCSCAPNYGGGNRYEDALVGYIDRRNELLGCIAQEKLHMARINKALGELNASERMILDKFYIHRTAEYKRELCEMLGCERSKMYQRKDEALQKYLIIRQKYVCAADKKNKNCV